MNALNRVQLIGHLGQDPDVIQHGEVMIAKFSMATEERWRDKSTQEKKEMTEWHKVVCFHQVAEVVKRYVKKGGRVYVSGKLKTSKWQDKNNTDHYTTEVVVEDLIMLDGKKVAVAATDEVSTER